METPRQRRKKLQKEKRAKNRSMSAAVQERARLHRALSKQRTPPKPAGTEGASDHVAVESAHVDQSAVASQIFTRRLSDLKLHGMRKDVIPFKFPDYFADSDLDDLKKLLHKPTPIVKKLVSFAKFDDKGEGDDAFTYYIADLKSKALTEDWGKDNLVLQYYVIHMLYHMIFSTQRDRYIIAYTSADEQDAVFAIFHTGLLSKSFNPLYGFLRLALPMQKDDVWCFDKWTEEQSAIFLAPKLPQRLVFHNTQESLLLDPLLEIVTNTEKILSEYNWMRLMLAVPPTYKDEPVSDHQHRAIQTLIGAIATSRKRCTYNYRLAVPAASFAGKVQLLLPMYISSAEVPNVALVLERRMVPSADDKQYYEATGLLKIGEAYNRARLIAVPEKHWLLPAFVTNADDESDMVE